MRPLLPDIHRLLELRDRGMSHQDIADWIERHEGVRVKRGAIASAFSRAGESTPRPRHRKHLPFKVKAQHGQHNAAKMLRAMGGRKDQGLPLSEEMDKKLESWLRRLREQHVVVAYAPETKDGFHYVDGDFNEDGIPLYSSRPILPRSMTR